MSYRWLNIRVSSLFLFVLMFICACVLSTGCKGKMVRVTRDTSGEIVVNGHSNLIVPDVLKDYVSNTDDVGGGDTSD